MFLSFAQFSIPAISITNLARQEQTNLTCHHDLEVTRVTVPLPLVLVRKILASFSMVDTVALSAHFQTTMIARHPLCTSPSTLCQSLCDIQQSTLFLPHHFPFIRNCQSPVDRPDPVESLTTPRVFLLNLDSMPVRPFEPLPACSIVLVLLSLLRQPAPESDAPRGARPRARPYGLEDSPGVISPQ
eukprot:767177-Hanusia_phi.AAC.8